MDALRTVNLKMVTGSIQICYDDQNNKYDLPVFIINPPHRFETKQETVGSYGDKRIKVKLQFLMHTPEVEVSLDDPVSKLHAQAVELVRKNDDSDPSQWVVRLVYQGKVFKEDSKIGVYLKDNSLVQVFKTLKSS